MLSGKTMGGLAEWDEQNRRNQQPKERPWDGAQERGGPLSTATKMQVQAKLTGGLVDPPDEFSARNLDLSKFVHSLVGFLQSKVNPDPNAPATGRGDSPPEPRPTGLSPDPINGGEPKNPQPAPKPKTGPTPVPLLPRAAALAAVAGTAGKAVGTTGSTISKTGQTSTVLQPWKIAGK